MKKKFYIISAIVVFVSLFGLVHGDLLAADLQKVELQNPLGSGPAGLDVRIILGKIANSAMGFLGAVVLLVFVYGGFLWLISAGNAERVKKGTQTMMWAVVGLFLIFAGYGIIGLVLEGVGAKKSVNQNVLQMQALPEGVSGESKTETPTPATTPETPPPAVEVSCKIMTDSELQTLCSSSDCRESGEECKNDCMPCEGQPCVKATVIEEASEYCSELKKENDCKSMKGCKWE